MQNYHIRLGKCCVCCSDLSLLPCHSADAEEDFMIDIEHNYLGVRKVQNFDPPNRLETSRICLPKANFTHPTLILGGGEGDGGGSSKE